MVLTGEVDQSVPDTLFRIDSARPPDNSYYLKTFDLQISTLDPELIYFEFTHWQGNKRELFVSSNGGAGWVRNTIPRALFREFDLFPSHTDRSTIYGAGGKAFSTQDAGIGIWKSIDFGNSWDMIQEGDPNVSFRVIDEDIFFKSDLLKFSSDQGMSWTRNIIGLPEIYITPQFRFPFVSDNKLFLVLLDENVYHFRSSYWSEIANTNSNRASSNKDGNSVAYSTTYGSSLYLSYYYDGLYKLRNSVTSVRSLVSQHQFPELYDVSSYPNPFSTSTIISFSLRERSNIKIEIYSTVGQLVKQFNIGNLEPEHYQFDWDGKNEEGIILNNGIYMCIIKSKTHQQVQKILLFR